MTHVYYDVNLFSSINEDELIDINGGSTKLAAAVLTAAAGVLTLTAAICGATGHPTAAIWVGSAAGACGFAAFICAVIPAP